MGIYHIAPQRALPPQRLGKEFSGTVLKEVCETFGVSTSSILQRTRKREVTDARMCAIRLLHEATNMEPVEIMETIGQHRTMFYHAISTTRSLEKTNKDFSAKLTKVRARIYPLITQ